MAAAYAVETAGNIRRALEIQKNFEPEVALIDLRLGAANGADLIVMLKQQRANLVCVMMTAYAEIDSAIEALRSGADDYLRKPLAQAELFTTLERGFAKLRLIHEKQAAESALRENREMLEAVLDAVARGDLLPGDRLPSVRGMASVALVNPNTVGKAYRELDYAGVARGRNGSGVFVTEDGPELARGIRRDATLQAYRLAAREALRSGHANRVLQAELDAVIENNAIEQNGIEQDGNGKGKRR